MGNQVEKKVENEMCGPGRGGGFFLQFRNDYKYRNDVEMYSGFYITCQKESFDVFRCCMKPKMYVNTVVARQP